MANSADLEKLCQGPKVWNDWRAESPHRIPDLSNARLSLSQRQFGPSNGGPINLQDVDLDGAELRNANLIGAHLSHANLVGVDLVLARLNDADLTGADLTDALLDSADLTDAKLDRAVLIGASLAEVRGLTQEQIELAYGDSSTVIPAYLMPPNNWFPPIDDDFFNECPIPESVQEADLYEILGVARTARPEQIRTAFRSLVKKLHPDLNPDDAEAQEAFKQVSGAYRILNDPVKRARYDRGEIGYDGEINPEFEAKRQFRRYAFRFYSAAAASLVLAVGLLVTVWYSVLMDGLDRGRIEIAVAAPPKNFDRLDGDAPIGISPPVKSVRPSKQPDSTLPVAEPDKSAGGQSEPAAEADQGQPQDAGHAQRNKVAAPHSGRVTPSHPASRSREKSSPRAVSQPAQAAVPNTDKKPGETIQASSDSGVQPANPALSPAPAATPAGSTAGARQSVPRNETKAADARPAVEAGTGARSAPPPSGQPPAKVEDQQLANLTETGQDTKAGVKPADRPAANASPQPETPQPPAPPGKAGPEQAPQLSQPSSEQSAIRPLGDQNGKNEARPAEADAARTVSLAPSPPQSTARVDADADAKGTGPESRASAEKPQGSLLLRSTRGRQSPRDEISEMFSSRAIRNALPQDTANATASVDRVLGPNGLGAEDEVRELYRHSIPDSGQKTSYPWPETLVPTPPAKKRLDKPSLSVAPAPVASADPRRDNRPAISQIAPDAGARKQAVSDILSGGL